MPGRGRVVQTAQGVGDGVELAHARPGEGEARFVGGDQHLGAGRLSAGELLRTVVAFSGEGEDGTRFRRQFMIRFLTRGG